MTTLTDIANRALQVMGTRTNVTDAELAGNLTNEALQINLKIDNVRRKLIRMAPWNFALKTINMIYITSSPGTPENSIAATTLWQPGQPAPPWNYEYQYPPDCERVCFVIPSTQTGFAGGIPITTAVTGGAASFWQGPPVKFKVQNDQFYSITALTLGSGGVGYAPGDIWFGPGMINPTTGVDTQPMNVAPIGGPVQVVVNTVDGSGAILTFTMISQVNNTQSAPASPGVTPAAPRGGSYFNVQPSPLAQSYSTGNGTGATFNATWSSNRQSQRVVLCNQEFAIGTYLQDSTDIDGMDEQFQDCYAKALGAEVTIALTGDKKLANMAVQEVNSMIQWARTGDANEGFTVNDVTPDWLRIRGIEYPAPYSGPFTGFDWGGMYPIFG